MPQTTDSLFSGYDVITLSDSDEAHCRNGRDFSLPAADGTYRLYGADGSFLMLAAVEAGAVRAVKRFH